MNRVIKIILVGLALIILVGVIGFLAWAMTPARAEPEALAALQSSSEVTVSQDYWLVFTPTFQQAQAGLVLYPGGHVDPRAYAATAHEIAAAGYLVVITPMPLNLAVLHPDAAAEVLAAYPEIKTWAVGGHSLGGAMAARFIFENPQGVNEQPVAGLVLWAAYPASTDDLTQRNLAVSSIFGTQDGLADPQTVTAARFLLPADTVWTPIQGGNHAQFGRYGPQGGDKPASITAKEQQTLVANATVALLEHISEAERVTAGETPIPPAAP